MERRLVEEGAGTHPEYCTVWVYCDPDMLLPRAVGFTW